MKQRSTQYLENYDADFLLLIFDFRLSKNHLLTRPDNLIIFKIC